MKRFELVKEGLTAGLHFVVLLQRSGNYTGYVGVPSDHKLFNTEYDAVDVDVHGGLTFSSKSYWDDSEDWYFGFDCAHYDDGVSIEEAEKHFDLKEYELDIMKMRTSGIFKDLDYLTRECKLLASQLSTV